MSLLLPLALFGISAIDWWVAGKKGVALLNRSPWLIFWACVEVALGAVLGYGLFDAFMTKELSQLVIVVVATTAGCALGCAFSGAVKWKDKA